MSQAGWCEKTPRHRDCMETLEPDGMVWKVGVNRDGTGKLEVKIRLTVWAASPTSTIPTPTADAFLSATPSPLPPPLSFPAKRELAISFMSRELMARASSHNIPLSSVPLRRLATGSCHPPKISSRNGFISDGGGGRLPGPMTPSATVANHICVVSGDIPRKPTEPTCFLTLQIKYPITFPSK